MVRGKTPKSDFPPIPISVTQWVPRLHARLSACPHISDQFTKADISTWRETWGKKFAMRLSQYICFSKVIATMFLSGGSWASPTMQSANQAKQLTDSPCCKAEETLFVRGCFLPMTVRCKSLRRVAQSLGSELGCCKMAFVIYTL